MDINLNLFDINKNNLSCLSLAYIGDSVFEVLSRSYFLSKNIPLIEVNTKVKEFVCAKNQSKIYNTIFDLLTYDEQEIIKRGRNTKFKNKSSKVATNKEYSCATGLEVLFGYLFINNKIDRLKEIFLICVEKA